MRDDNDFYVNDNKILENPSLDVWRTITFTWTTTKVYVQLDFGGYVAYDLKNIYSGSFPLKNIYIGTTPGNTGTFLVDDFQFDLVNTDDWTTDLYTLDPNAPDFIMPIQQVCFIGIPCRIDMIYNSLAVGMQVYWIWENGQPQFPEYASYSYTLSNVQPYSQTFMIASNTVSVATTTPYSIWIGGEDFDGRLMQGLKLIWVDSDTYDLDLFNADPCEDVATSSGLFDDLRYGIECGFRRLSYWAFQPDLETVTGLSTSRNKLASTFPFL